MCDSISIYNGENDKITSLTLVFYINCFLDPEPLLDIYQNRICDMSMYHGVSRTM